MMLRLLLVALLSVGAVAQCEICVYGGLPTNLNALLPDGIYCGFYIDNAPTGQSCALIRQPANQILCGCPRGPSTKAPTRKPTTRAPAGSSPTRKPTTRTPTRKPTTRTPTRKPTFRTPTRKPTTRTPTRKPTTRTPTRKPTTRAPTRNVGCQMCVNGGTPSKLTNIVDPPNGLLCSYYFFNQALLSSSTCAYIRLPVNQKQCGCAGF